MPEISTATARKAELLAQSEVAAHRAYAPYSHFYVGAAILLDTGEIISGCNVENASFRLTTCAEQAAVACAVAAYGPNIRIRAVAISNLNHAACQPCGACRQTLAEFAGPDTLIIYPGDAEQACTCTLADLLPASFRLTPQ